MNLVYGKTVRLNIQLCFYIADKGMIGDKLVAWKTNSKYSHVELIIDDLRVSSIIGKGVHVTNRGINEDYYDIINFTLDITLARYNEVMKWIKLQDKKYYDNIGILLSQLFPFGINDENKWFCSEIVCKVLQLLGHPIVFDMVPNLTTPEDLYAGFKKYNT